jgi:hypothetical protein
MTTTPTSTRPTSQQSLGTARGRIAWIGQRERLALTIGRRSGPGAGAPIHRVSLGAAAFLALLAVWCLVCADAVHSERAARMVARNPIPVSQGAAADSEVARWWERPDTVEGRSVSVIFLRPTTQDAVPPPGLDRWPKPGEAFLSPALREASPAMSDRYGRPAGEISRQGLADASELVAYVNPERRDYFTSVFETTSRISGFGNPSPDRFFIGSHQFDRGVADLYVIILLMAGLPCAALVLVAVRSRAEVRDRRLALLDAMGAPSRVRALVLAGESFTPIAVGIFTASASALALSFVSPTLPFTGYTLWSQDLQAALPELPLTALGVFVALVMLAIAAGIRRTKRASSRPTRISSSRARWPYALFAVGMALAVWGSEHRGASGRTAFVVGAIVTLIALPYAAAQLARLLGRGLAARGFKNGDPVRLVAGRWLAARPAALARLSAALVVGLGIVMIGQVFTTQFTGPAQEARSRYQSSDAEILQVRSREIPATAAEFVSAVGEKNVIRYSPEPGTSTDSPEIRLTGNCDALAVLGTIPTCPISPQSAEDVFSNLTPMGHEVFEQGEMVSGPIASICACTAPTGGDKSLYGFLVRNTAGEKGVSAVEQAAYSHLIGPMTARPGQSWFLGAQAQAEQTRWLVDAAMLGLVALACAGALGAAGIFLEQAGALGPLAAFCTERSFYSKVAFWNLSVPLGAVGIVGAIVAAVLGGLLINLGRGGWMSLSLLAVGLTTVAVAGLCVAIVCGRVAANHAQAWRPQGD